MLGDHSFWALFLSAVLNFALPRNCMMMMVLPGLAFFCHFSGTATYKLNVFPEQTGCYLRLHHHQHYLAENIHTTYRSNLVWVANVRSFDSQALE